MKISTTSVLLAAGLLISPPALAQKSKNSVRIAFSDPVSTVDSIFDPKGETSATAAAVYDTLVQYNHKTKGFDPLLAKSWKRLSPTVWEFQLRDDVKFHNGMPLTAEDVEYTLGFASNPKTKFRIKTSFLWIKKVTATGKHTVQIETKRPYAMTLARLSGRHFIYPKAIFSKYENKSDFGRKTPIGTGPYKVISVDPNQGIVLEKNDAYTHATEAKPAGKIQRIEILPVPDDQTKIAKMMVNGIDLMVVTNPDLRQSISASPNNAVTVNSGDLNFFYIALDALDRTGIGHLKDIRVRTAINHAINRDAIRKNLVAGGDKAIDMKGLCLPAQIGCSYDLGTQRHAYDLAKAKQLMKEAGKEQGFDVDIVTVAWARQVAEAIAGDLSKINIKAKIKSMTMGAYRKAQGGGKVQILVQNFSMGGVPDTASGFTFYFGSKARDYYGDAEIKSRLKKINSIFDQTERDRIAKEMLTLNNKGGYVIPISSNPTTFAHPKDLVIETGSIVPFGADLNRMYWK
ncbi:MAG: ABC transporter substrate-binding protein [Rhodospirillaceae bacterium]|jgi:peptide/nickel transport system substrate-binding protein